ncbi:ras-interacting protein RIP3 isoform X1 [Drosophila sulfurigaster albostrigata]|uniref:ras-interacting protein RIP3 isoform X1 n=2 Tax=Drosophila sulfurigaster albostrigata TaxID=89887 RepID=UPI002D21CB31|nr:ras-interacting protein RIP3 isoform X1 [Drosophila sulfurigaster albostrigata]
MVLTNFECWAHGETADAVNFETGPARNSTVVDPFNARVVSHIASASNGYYGYAIVNNEAAAVASAADNNNNSCNNNNLQQQHQQQQQQQAMQVNDDGVSAAAAAAVSAARCKKRCFAMGHEQLDMEMDNLTAVKRCRFDDADLVAQYCNDFFSMPATQMIGTQACLMDYDYDVQQQQMQQQQQQQQLLLQQQQQQQQQEHPRIHQHYQDSPERERKREQEQQLQQPQPQRQLSKNDIQLDDKCETKLLADSADLYIATHGGCLHHFKPLPLCRSLEPEEEFDI